MEKEIEKLAEKEYPINDWSDEATVYNREQVNKRIGFIKGYQQAQEEQNRKAAMINPPNLDDVLTKKQNQ